MEYFINFNQILDCFYVSEDAMRYIQENNRELSGDDVNRRISYIIHI